MKALLLKDFYDNKKGRFIYIVMFSIGFAMVFNETHNYTYLFWLNLLMLLDIRISFEDDYKTKWIMYLKTLPVNRKMVVMSQYLTFLMNILLSVLTFTLISVCYGLSGNVDWLSIFNDATILLAMNLFLQSLICLIVYACTDKQLTFYFGIVNAIFLVEFILHGDELALASYIFTIPGMICVLAACIFYAISILVCIKLYDTYSYNRMEDEE